MNHPILQVPVDVEDHSLAGQIARTLSVRIVSGEVAPGMPLRQDRIAAEFGASHVPVREAFRKLEALGLVVSEPRRGVRVAPMDAAVLREVTQMRAALEPLALRHAVPRLSSDDLNEAESALSASAASDSIALWETANRRFHYALARACGMPRLLATIDDLHRVSARFLFATWKELDWQPRSDREHRAILRTTRKGDAEQAAGLLAEHILAAGKALEARLKG